MKSRIGPDGSIALPQKARDVLGNADGIMITIKSDRLELRPYFEEPAVGLEQRLREQGLSPEQALMKVGTPVRLKKSIRFEYRGETLEAGMTGCVIDEGIGGKVSVRFESEDGTPFREEIYLNGLELLH